ncbi:MAG: hypothetical protein HC882_03535 [Acidobacteria bacterium]|nr:hypothetical protein [Acidobacteriota bacterium]
MSRRLALVLVATAATMASCVVIDYPIVTDVRGGYEGIVRTAHKAYIVPTGTVAFIYADGSDEIYSMVSQNQYGDQMLYTFNNFDPTGSVVYLDRTYCDWKFDDCEVVRAWNPVQNDEPFDYEFFSNCSGARSIDLLLSMGTRIGECGDVWFGDKSQAFAALFAELDTTTWRGSTAYHLPVNAGTVRVTLTDGAGISHAMPIFGQIDVVITDALQAIVPMKPTARHQLAWLRGWALEHGERATMTVEIGGLRHETDVVFRTEGLAYNEGRF